MFSIGENLQQPLQKDHRTELEKRNTSEIENGESNLGGKKGISKISCA
jgi:hypothetical protein